MTSVFWRAQAYEEVLFDGSIRKIYIHRGTYASKRQEGQIQLTMENDFGSREEMVQHLAMKCCQQEAKRACWNLIRSVHRNIKEWVPYDFPDEVKAITRLRDFFYKAGFSIKQKVTLNFWIDIIIPPPNENNTLSAPKTIRTKRSRQDLSNADPSRSPSPPPRKNVYTIKHEVKEEIKAEIKAKIKGEVKEEVEHGREVTPSDDTDERELLQKADETEHKSIDSYGLDHLVMEAMIIPLRRKCQ